jgi:ankyrin repeat protein
LVSKGFSIHATTSTGQGSVVAAAAKIFSTKLVTQLLNAHADVNGVAFRQGPLDNQKQAITNSEEKLKGTHGMTALHIAVRNKNEMLTRLPLFYGANANQYCHVYPLQLAAWSGDEPITRMLIEAGADINAVADEDHCHVFQYPATGRQYISAHTTAMAIASERGYRNLIAILGGSGVELLTSNPGGAQRNCIAVLCDAIVDGNTTLVDQLLADVALRGGRLHPQHSARALVLAIRESQDQGLSSLIHAGANPYEILDPDFQGMEDLDYRYMFYDPESAFEKVIGLDSMDTVRVFLKLPTTVLDEEQRLARKRQLSAAYASAICKGNLELKAAVRENGLEPGEIDQFMGPNYVKQRLHFALQHAAALQDYAQVEQLLEAGAEPNSPNQNTADTSGMLTPLQYAIKHNNFQLVEALIQAGAIANVPPNPMKGRTALQLAASSGITKIVELLVKAGADINAPAAAYEGRTAIEAAAEQGHLKVVIYLANQGADIRGRYSIVYRRLIYRSWEGGYHGLTSEIQNWKIRNDGWLDTEPIESILESMTEDELTFVDEAAKHKYEAQVRDVDTATDSDGEESCGYK